MYRSSLSRLSSTLSSSPSRSLFPSPSPIRSFAMQSGGSSGSDPTTRSPNLALIGVLAVGGSFLLYKAMVPGKKYKEEQVLSKHAPAAVHVPDKETVKQHS